MAWRTTTIRASAVEFDFHTGGYPMTTTSYAAFYPAFFLHHCNVDRLYGKSISEPMRTRDRVPAIRIQGVQHGTGPFVNKKDR